MKRVFSTIGSARQQTMLGILLVLALLAIPFAAFADNVVNNVTIGGTDTFTAPGSTTIGYRINATGGDGQMGCNASDGSPATVTLSVPAGVTASTTSLTFTVCNVFQNVTFSSSTPGNYAINVSSITDAGTGSYSNQANFTLHVLTPPDSTPPDTTITANPANLTNSTSASFSFTGSDNVTPAGSLTFECSLDGGPFAGCTSPQGYSGLANGSHTFQVRAKDAANNVDPTPASFTWTVDTVPPTITFVGPSTSAWYNSDVTANWNCSDASGVLSASVTAMTSGEGNAQPATGTCTDNADNTATNTQSFMVDKTAPSISATPNPAANLYGWNNTDVTVSYSCTDGVSGVNAGASDLADDVLTASGTVSGTCVDMAGNSATASYTAQIDKDKPVIAGSRTPAPNVHGWNKEDVVVSFTCTDSGGSGIDTNTVAGATVSTEGAGQTVTNTGSCTDKAGNTADSATVSGINIDKTAPTASASASPAANTSGWNNTDVTVSFIGDDGSGSGIDFCAAPVVLSSEGANQSASGTCTDKAGNVSAPASAIVNIDKTAPTANASASPGPNGNGWNNTDVTISFSGSDGLSGIDSCAALVVLSSEGANQSASGTCTDKAGNVSAPATASGINIDKTNPVITFVSRTPANGNGWNNGDVTVNWNCTDSGSGVVSASVSQTVSAEGANQSATGTCTDNAGNTASDPQTNINIDKTVPSVTLVGGPANGASYYFGSVPAAPTCSASDALSGLASSCSLSGYSSAVGSHTVTASVTDKAGNPASAPATYTVLAWTLSGFYSPVDMSANVWNTVKGGATVPLKFEIFAGSTELTNTSYITSFTAKEVSCAGGGTEDPVDFVTTGGTSLRYDSTAGQFVQNWQTPKQAGKCYKVTMTAQDGSALVALFKLK